MALERIIRPFETNTPFTRSGTAVVVGGISTAVIDVTYGDDAAEPKLLSGSNSVSISFYCDQKTKIKPVASNIRRVESEDDPDTYVDVEEFTKVGTKQGSGQDFQRTKDTYDTTGTESANAKIIRKRQYPYPEGDPP